MAGYWVVAITKPSREKWAAENVHRQGFAYYLPMIEKLTVQVTKGGAKTVTVPQPLFPRYLFVYSDGRWRALLSTFGVSSLVLEGGGPAVLPDREIASLRARENARGFVQLPSVRPPSLNPGDAVSIGQGPLRGIYEGAADGHRVKVLMDLLGKKVTHLIDEASVAPV